MSGCFGSNSSPFLQIITAICALKIAAHCVSQFGKNACAPALPDESFCFSTASAVFFSQAIPMPTSR